MASILARKAAHTVYTRAIPITSTRRIHLNVVAQQGWLGNLFRGSDESQTAAKKQPEAVKDSESTVASSANADVTVKSTTTTTTTPIENTPVPPPTRSEVIAPKSRSKPKRRRLSPEEKTQRYNDTIAFITPRLGRHPELKLPKIRKTTWIRLLGVCQTEEELRNVVGLFSGWRAMDNKFDAAFSETFIRRCLHLNAPQVSLDVFGNYAKYNVPLTLTGARELLNATYDKQPLSSIITITSLFNIYNLPPVAQDLPCCAMVVSACLKDGSADALVVGKALLPHLQKILDNAGPQPIPKTEEKGDDMPRVWASWALKKTDQLLFKAKGQREEWLRDWRLRSGHIAEAGQF